MEKSLFFREIVGSTVDETDTDDDQKTPEVVSSTSSKISKKPENNFVKTENNFVKSPPPPEVSKNNHSSPSPVLNGKAIHHEVRIFGLSHFSEIFSSNRFHVIFLAGGTSS